MLRISFSVIYLTDMPLKCNMLAWDVLISFKFSFHKKQITFISKDRILPMPMFGSYTLKKVLGVTIVTWRSLVIYKFNLINISKKNKCFSTGWIFIKQEKVEIRFFMHFHNWLNTFHFFNLMFIFFFLN